MTLSLRPERGTAEPGPRPLDVLPSLLVYHVLILLGAFLAVFGIFRGLDLWLAAGLALVAGGIAVQAAVLVRSGRAARSGSPIWESAPTTQAYDGGSARSFCASCGWNGGSTGLLCPRCRKPLARLR